MSARSETNELMRRIGDATGIFLSFDDANTLRRAQLVLQRWSELECGNRGSAQSWAIERDETKNLPYMCIYPNKGEMVRYRVADREASALKRIKTICAANGLHYYHQTDPRGCALYVSNKPLPDNNYTSGVPCCA